MKISKDVFKFAGIGLTKANSSHPLVPKVAQKIYLSPSDNKALALAVKENLPCLLMGETGVGKTSAVRYLALLLKQPYVRVNMTGYTTPDELIGSKSAKDGSTYYEDGIITNAMRIGAILVLDEINATPPDCAFILHGLLDDDRRITLPNGDIVTPHKDFRFFATMNPDYEGTKSINRAFLDRFPLILEIDTLAPAKEKALLVEHGLDKELAESFVALATIARKAYFENKTLTFVSTRGLLQITHLIKEGLDPKRAYELAAVKKARKNEQSAFRDFYNAVFKSKTSDDPEFDETPEVITKGEKYRMEKENERLKVESANLSLVVSDADKKIAEKEKSRSYYKERLTRAGAFFRKVKKEVGEEKIEKIKKDFERDWKKESKKRKKTIISAHFQIGDFVRGINNRGRYSITKAGWEGKVERVSKNRETISVMEVDGGKNHSLYDVSAKDFVKIARPLLK